jgi:3-carboxy-cis,cis-muconate cycloisomerase
MPFSPADSHIFAPLFSQPELAEIFSDEQFIQSLLHVEGALAQVEGHLGLIPTEAGEAISSVALSPATAGRIDIERLRLGLEQDGFPIIELVRQLRQLVGKEYGDSVHYGATTQDILDTGLILRARVALEVIERQLEDLVANLVSLADRHRHTLMAGRTHSQQALPITFGFKVANWLAPLLRDRERLNELKPRLLVVQFGGAAGTLAALSDRGTEVQTALAERLGLGVPLMPWHAQRDNLAELAGWLSLVSGSLAKMAQDIILLAQSEVGEVHESDDPAYGGSSSMPQKNNPITSELILAAGRANIGQLASLHQALFAEHERGTYSLQLEWLSLPQMFGLTSSSLTHAVWLSKNIEVDEKRMQEQVRASNGLLLSEALAAALAPTMGRSEAKGFVKEAVRIAQAKNQNLFDVAQERTDTPLDWQALRNEADYLGSAEKFIDRVLQAAQKG